MTVIRFGLAFALLALLLRSEIAETRNPRGAAIPTGQSAALVGGAAAGTVAAGPLTTGIKLAGTPSASSSGSGSLTTGTPTCSSRGTIGVWADVSPSAFHTPSNVEVQAVAVDPVNHGIIYAAGSNYTNGGNSGGGVTATGLYKSTDCGVTWAHVSTGTLGSIIDGGMLWAIKVDFNTPTTIYVASGYNNNGPLSIYKSTNSGVDWVDSLGGGKSLTVQGSPGGTQLTIGQVVNNEFVQAVGMDKTNPAHLVITFHNNCFNNGGTWGTINTSDVGVQCFAETTDSGTNWRFFAGPVPSAGWQEASSMTVLNSTTYILTTATGSYYTANSGSSWAAEPFGATYGQYSAGGYLAPNGKLYIGGNICCSTNGVWESSGSPLGSPGTWTLLAGSPSIGATTITSDGTTLFSSYWNDGSGQPFYSALFSNLTSWTHMSDPTSPAHGSDVMETDMINFEVYSATGVGGVQRLRTQ